MIFFGRYLCGTQKFPPELYHGGSCYNMADRVKGSFMSNSRSASIVSKLLRSLASLRLAPLRIHNVSRLPIQVPIGVLPSTLSHADTSVPPQACQAPRYRGRLNLVIGYLVSEPVRTNFAPLPKSAVLRYRYRVLITGVDLVHPYPCHLRSRPLPYVPTVITL